MRAQRGFTLLEVMITLVIVAIMAAIALPSYSAYVTRGNIIDATKGLSEMRLKMEQFFQDQRTYSGACVNGTVAPLPTPTDRFTFSCSNLGLGTYTVHALGVGRMSGFEYTINETNTQVTVSTGSSGWPTCGSRWILKAADTCS